MVFGRAHAFESISWWGARLFGWEQSFENFL